MNIERALAIPGWMTENELTYLAEVASRSHLIAEIGCWRGRSSRALADNTPGIVFCVDTWADHACGIPGWWSKTDPESLCHQHNWLWKEFQKNLKDHIAKKVVRFRLTSLEAARTLEARRFDCIFIDAGHTYEEVTADILAWRPLLAPGGVLCGHDYCNEHPGVQRAVNELVRQFRVVDSLWTTEMQ